jgi:hypothetical protein
LVKTRIKNPASPAPKRRGGINQASYFGEVCFMTTCKDIADDICVMAVSNDGGGLDRIKKASRRLRWFCTLLMILLPLGTAHFWMFPQSMPSLGHRLPVPITPDVPSSSLFLGFLVSMVSVCVGVWALSRLRKLFALYEKGMIFHHENIKCLRGLGRAIIAWVIAAFVSYPLLSVILTYHRPQGQRLLSVGLSSSDIASLLAGCAVLVIAWVMEQGRHLQEEQALIV